jgi:ABC-2 type transport system ATP-binding protein
MPYAEVTMPAVRVEGVRKTYGSLTVLDGVDLQVMPGRVLALLGPNGAGKTTLVRILSTLLAPDAGTATVAGHDLIAAPDAVRASIGFTGQHAAIDEVLTGEENLVMMARLHGLDRSRARVRARQLVEQFDLVAAKRRVKTYSGGMTRRLDLAMSLVTRPPVLFLDEPTTGLDPRSRQTLWAAIRDLVAEGTTVLLTTQYLEEADQLADEIVVIDQGMVIAAGTSDELKGRIAAEFVELDFADEATCQRAALAIGPNDCDGGRLVVTTNGTPGELRDLLNRLAQLDIAVAAVTTRRPSLDDVFFSLTGNVATTERAAS